jgi:phage terminase large subunit-like protein
VTAIVVVDMTLAEELVQYSNDIISGKIIACTKHKWACMRFIRDFERQGSDDFPYVFDEKKAQRIVNWVKLFKHRKGVLKGQFINPNIYQKFILCNIYGWINCETGYRRFNKAYIQLARKNAKSQIASAIASFELMALDEKGIECSEVYCAATKTEQAKIVYNETLAMLRGCNVLKGKWKEAYGRIVHLKTDSIMRALSEEDRKTGDGLNPQCGIIDEYHAHETSEMYDIIDSGMGARVQPLLFIITTAGFELNNPCYRVEYDLVSKILNPDIDYNLDNYFVMINELETNQTSDTIEIDGRKVAPGELIDDINDEKVWEKANPIICSYPEGRDYIRKKLAEAKQAPEKMRNFLTKHMNVWVNQTEHGYMNMEKWAACKGEMPDLRGQTCYVGLDLSAKLDLTSASFEFKIDEIYYVLSHSFMPEDKFHEKMNTDKVPYDLWVKQGYITLTDGPIVDYRTAKQYVIDYAKENNFYIEEICGDPWGAQQISNDFQDEGFEFVEIIQGVKTLSEPTKNFREMVYAKRVVHDGNPVLTWAVSNAIAEAIDRNENIMLSKKKSKNRIDPIASVINAHVRCMNGESGVYNQRGMRSLDD